MSQNHPDSLEGFNLSNPSPRLDPSLLFISTLLVLEVKGAALSNV
jgi:hypothetical protein